MYIYRCKNTPILLIYSPVDSELSSVLQLYLFKSMCPYLCTTSSLFIISCAKLLHNLVKTLYCKLSFQILCILPNLSMQVF